MANVKFSELPAGAALTGAEIIADSQGGVSVRHTIQDIAEFVGDTSFNYGDGISYVPGTNTISADINTTNLQFTANQINTIQDIATTASPTFNALTLNGKLEAFSGFQSYSEQVIIGASQNVDTTIIGRTAINNSASDYVLTIPLGAGFNLNAEFDIIRAGSGNFSVQAAAGVTINGIDGALISLPDQYDRAVYREISENVWTSIEYSGAVGAITQQDVYDNSPNGLIALNSGKPFGFTSTVAGFLPPSMLQAEFDAIPTPDSGLMAWTTNRYRVNVGTPGSPAYEQLAYFTDIPQDDTSYAQISFKNNATATVITAPATYVKVNGTYAFGLNLNFTEAAGVLTYTGVETKVFDLGCSLSATLNLASETITGALFKNGAEVVDSGQSVFLGPTSPDMHSLSINTLVSLSTGDTIEFRVQNDDTDDDITVTDFSLCCSTVGGAIGNADDQVVISWDGLTTPTSVTAGTLIDITGGVISTSAEANVVTAWNGLTTPVAITAGTLMSLAGGVVSTSAEANVVSLWDGAATPVNVTAGTNITITGGVISATGGGGGSLQSAYNIGNEIDQSGGPRVKIRATDDAFLDLILDADGIANRSGVSTWAENSAGTLINTANIKGWLPGNTPGSEYSILEWEVFDEITGTMVKAMHLSGQRTSQPGLLLNGNYDLNAGGRGGFGVSVGFPNEIDQSCQFDVKSPFDNLLSKPYPAMTQAQIDAVSGPITGGLAYNTDSSRLRVNIGTSGAPVRREFAYTSDLPVGRLTEVLATTQVPVVTYPFDVWTSMMGTLNGSNIISANTFTTGQTIEVDITGIWTTTVNGNNSNIRVSFGGVVLATSSNLAVTGFTGVREWSLKFKITVTGGSTITASAVGWYSDASNNMRPMSLIITPFSLPYNSTIANTIDVEFNPSSIGGTTDFIANNLNIIQYK